MTIRTILTAMSSGAGSAAAIDTGCQLARRFNAHLEALHVRVDERTALLTYGDGLGAPGVAGDLMQRIADQEKATAMAVKSAFDAAVSRHGLPPGAVPPTLIPGRAPVFEPSAAWREETGYVADFIEQRGRMADLIILGRAEPNEVQRPSETVEDALLRSGRPVLVASPQPGDELGRVIAVGWNGSAESMRALVAALPFLAEAEDIRLITIADTDEGLGTQGVEYLAWHGIAATARFFLPIEKVGAGEQLLAQAHDEGADLLVMGAYGHASWREMLFGGATREVVGASLLPLLLSH